MAGLLYWQGEAIKIFIDKYFNILSIVFFVLLILGFYIIKFVAGGEEEEPAAEG